MKIIRVIFLLCVIGALAVFFGCYPEKPFKGEIERVEVSYSTYSIDTDATFTVTEEEELKEFNEVTGWVWSQFGPVNSWEGDPSWMIEVHRVNGEKERIYVDEDELGNSASPPEQLVTLLKTKYSEPVASGQRR